MDPVFVTAIELGSAIVFLAGAWDKWHDRELFAAAMDAYDLLPSALVPAAALGLILLEAATGVALLMPLSSPWPAACGVFLLLLVTAAVAVNLLRGRSEISCGCGGTSGDQQLSWALVLRNLVLGGLLGATVLPTATRTMGGFDHAIGLLAGLMLAGLFAATSQLLANGPRLDALRNH